MIRVLHCVAGLGRGGCETFIMNLYRNIDRTKVQFDFLYSFDGVFNEEVKALGGRLFKIPFITEAGPLEYRKAVKSFLNEHKEYTIIHSHMDKFSGLIVEVAKEAGVKIRIAHSHSIKNEGGFLFQIVKNYYGKKINKNATHRLACSEEAYVWLFNNNTENKTIVKNGIDLQKFTNVDNRQKDLFTIASIGRFVQAKNHSFLIDVFSEVYKKDKSARLFLAGTGSLQDKIKKKVLALELAHVVDFLNDVSDIPTLLSRTDVVCMPSEFEGLGIALIEAQGCGCKCVASDSIPREAKVCDDIEFMSLKQSPKMWADEIILQRSETKSDNSEKIKAAGYDIKSVALDLTELYCS